MSSVEMEAWARTRNIRPSPREYRALRRLDVAMRASMAKKRPKFGRDGRAIKADPDPVAVFKPDDVVGVKAMFASLARRAKAVHGKKAETKAKPE